MSTEADPPRISIIIPAQNAEHAIGACVRSLARQTIARERYEIVVVDDGSSDATGTVAREAGADRVIRKEKGGFAAATRNLGIQAAQGEIACFTDADCEAAPDWLEEITAPLENPEIAGVKGAYLSRQRQLVARFVQLEYEDKYDRLREQQWITFIDFYSAAYRRQILMANGGFDERFPNSEDREFSFRLAARGYRMVFQPGAVVFHTHAATFLDYFRKKTRNGYWTAQVVSRFPTHGVDDSYTPPALKIQIGLIGLFWLSLLAAIVLPEIALVALLALVLFFLTTVGFVRKAWRRDRVLAVSSPFLLVTRATALGLGYLRGILQPIAGLDDEQITTVSGFNYLAKRALDVVLSLPGLLLLLPPALVMAGQRRGEGDGLLERVQTLGQHGEPFTRYQFGYGRLCWAPQLWNVLRGHMSLVGPRPEPEAALDDYEDWQRRRLSVKPGLVTPSSGAVPRAARLTEEIAYITDYSLGRDLRLLLRALIGGANRK